jgi:hypothetical protein
MSDNLGAFPATFQRFSMLADGTIRAVIDIEPKDRVTALAVLDSPGVCLGIARLTNQAAVEHDRSRMAEEPADPLPAHRLPTPLSSRVAMTCGERSFASFLRASDPEGYGAVERSVCADPVVQYVRDLCGVNSRSEIKPGTPAAERWDSLRADYEHWQRETRDVA